MKRKSKVTRKTKEKRSKRSAEFNEESLEDEAVVEEETGPTVEELLESEKPENVSAIETVRQKKKQKHKQRLDQLKDQVVGKERMRNEIYLHQWKHSHAVWKFEKLRQISIQQTIFDEAMISAEFWAIALEYLSGSKGSAKAKIIKLSEDCIDELDKECEKQTNEIERQKIINSTKYQRARDLLQSFG